MSAQYKISYSRERAKRGMKPWAVMRFFPANYLLDGSTLDMWQGMSAHDTEAEAIEEMKRLERE